MAFNKIFNGEEQKRIKHLIDEGCRVKQEVEMLNEGMRDTVKAIAEEMELKPSDLNKAIAVAYKDSFADEYEKIEALETILDTAGHNTHKD
jgi:galactokinase